jgi:hypothetical protein
MNIYIVTRSQIDDDFAKVGHCFTQIVIAETSTRAQSIASDNSGNEGKSAWLFDGSDVETIECGRKSEHIFSDFREIF